MVVSLLSTSSIGEHHYARPVVVPLPPRRADAPDPQTTSPWRTVFCVTARASTNWSR
jgi:hypothetical protein